MMMPFKPCATLLIAGGLALSSLAGAARVTVTVDGIRSSTGSILVGLSDEAASFPDRFIEGQQGAAKAPSITLTFDDVKPGRYALSAFHDLNDNGKLDRGAFGIPKEPFGFSRDAAATMGPPSFDDAAFDVPAEGIALVVHLK